MNERIRELSKKAVDYANACEAEAWDGAYERKFAELIVRECLDQCYNRGMNDELYAGQLKAAAYIEEHFGVDSMSTEDKKTLIKELLGVKND